MAVFGLTRKNPSRIFPMLDPRGAEAVPEFVQKVNYTASVQEMPIKDCQTVKEAVSTTNHVICEVKK
jgi:hypothetical protein